jgi:Spy/CpxP family protein refolding chaperone
MKDKTKKNIGGLIMKKRLMTISGIALLVVAIAIPVYTWAHGWRGYHMMGRQGMGPGYGWQQERGFGNITPEQQEKLGQLDRKFYDETVDLRNELWKKSSDLNMLLTKADPDLEKVKSVQKEIRDLQAKLDEKRLKYELEAQKILPGLRAGGGYGSFHGPHMGGMMGPGMGYGPMGCWN